MCSLKSPHLCILYKCIHNSVLVFIIIIMTIVFFVVIIFIHHYCHHLILFISLQLFPIPIAVGNTRSVLHKRPYLRKLVVLHVDWFPLMGPGLLFHDDVIKWNNFPRYWPFVRGFHVHWWIPLTKASDVELRCFPWSAPEHTVEQTTETPVTWDDISLIITTLQCGILKPSVVAIPCINFAIRIGIKRQLTILSSMGKIMQIHLALMTLCTHLR